MLPTLQALLFALVAAAGAWEWAGLVGAKTAAQRGGFAVVVPLLCFLLWQRIGLSDQQPATEAQPWLAVSAFFWSAMLLALKYYPSGNWLLRQTWVRAVMGWLILSGTWLAVAVCLTFDNGSMVMLVMILTVAAADIGAYFVGRRFGRHALAKEISPGKTWEDSGAECWLSRRSPLRYGKVCPRPTFTLVSDRYWRWV